MTIPAAKQVTGKKVDWKMDWKTVVKRVRKTVKKTLKPAACLALVWLGWAGATYVRAAVLEADARTEEERKLSCQTARTKLTSRKIEPEGCWYRGSTECWCSGVNDLNQPLVFTCEGKACSVSTNTPGGTP